MRRSLKAYTLVETLIGLVLFSILILGILNIQGQLLQFRAAYEQRQELEYAFSFVDRYLTELYVNYEFLDFKEVKTAIGWDHSYGFRDPDGGSNRILKVENYVKPSALITSGTQSLFSSRILFSDNNGSSFAPLHSPSVNMTFFSEYPAKKVFYLDARMGKIIQTHRFSLPFHQLSQF